MLKLFNIWAYKCRCGHIWRVKLLKTKMRVLFFSYVIWVMVITFFVVSFTLYRQNRLWCGCCMFALFIQNLRCTMPGNALNGCSGWMNPQIFGTSPFAPADFEAFSAIETPQMLRPRPFFYRTDCTHRSKFLTHALGSITHNPKNSDMTSKIKLLFKLTFT